MPSKTNQSGQIQGLAALVMLLRFHGLSADPEHIRHRFGRGTIGIPEMLRWAKELGLKARARLTAWERLASTAWRDCSGCSPERKQLSSALHIIRSPRRRVPKSTAVQ